jgi:hypothetical protein
MRSSQKDYKIVHTHPPPTSRNVPKDTGCAKLGDGRFTSSTVDKLDPSLLAKHWKALGRYQTVVRTDVTSRSVAGWIATRPFYFSDNGDEGWPSHREDQ